MLNDTLMLPWGFRPMQQAYFLSYQETNSAFWPARVTFIGFDHYRVLPLGSDSEILAKPRGRIMDSGQSMPVAGDWVVIENIPGDHEFLPIESVLPRVTTLRRATSSGADEILAANIDWIGIVTSFNHDLNLRRIERALAMVQDSGARPLLIVNKADLVTDEVILAAIDQLSQRFQELPLFSCAATSGLGVDELLQTFAPGDTVSFLGMSGVGKSSLINAILNKERMRTLEIREDDSRGRHSTTHRELIQSAYGFWVMDAPGIREFSFAGDLNSLDESFSDITQWMGACRFADCQHQSEPGCGILNALESGELDRDRWDHFLKLQREAIFHQEKHNKAFRSEQRKLWAKRNQMGRERMKLKGRN